MLASQGAKIFKIEVNQRKRHASVHSDYKQTKLSKAINRLS